MYRHTRGCRLRRVPHKENSRDTDSPQQAWIIVSWERKIRLKPLGLLLAVLMLFNASPLAKENADMSQEKAGTDVMIVAVRPGDEYLYLNGILTEYCAERGYTAVVVYMTSRDETQREEAAAALCSLGVTTPPVFIGQPDVYAEDADTIAKVWDEKSALNGLIRAIRQYRPAVIVSHDLHGEYGDGANMLTARYVQRAVKYAAGTSADKESYTEFGAWSTLRLFLHLYEGEANVVINRTVPLEAFRRRSAAEVEQDVYDSFSEDYRYPLSAADPVYGRAEYGLIYSDPSIKTLPQCNDLFSGLNPDCLNGPNAPRANPAVSLAADAPSPWPNEDTYFRQPGDPAEVVLEDWDNEHWEYRTDTLSIIIDRYHVLDVENKPVAYCIAHIRMRGEDAFRAGVRGEEGGTKSKEYPVEMARRYQAVLAITGDNLTVNEPEHKGVIIRNGRVYQNTQNAETMALLPDMSMKIYKRGEITAPQLQALGVENAFSFGPVLIRDGLVNYNGTRYKISGRNPRTGIGMAAPGHFVAITIDGRISTYSHGATLRGLMRLFYLEGCRQAYNLDGGSSTAMVFMGEYLNQHRRIEGGGAGMRGLPDMLLWGKSSLVPAVDDPIEHEVYYD